MEDDTKLLFSGILVRVYGHNNVLPEVYTFNSLDHVASNIKAYDRKMCDRFIDFSKSANIGDTFHFTSVNEIYCSITRTN